MPCHTPESTYLSKKIFILLLLALMAMACESETTVAGPDFPFASGDFTIFTNLVDDRCLDGGLNPLFMPLGDVEPWQWPLPVAVYAPSELPRTYDISLREPFNQMTVRVTQLDATTQQFVSEPNPRVELGPDRFGECVVELDGVVNITLLDSNTLEGIAALQMRNPRGDERCPADMPSTCEVVLSFDGTRSAGN